MKTVDLKKQLVDLLIASHVTFGTNEIAERLIENGVTIQSVAKWREEVEYYDDEYSECNVRKIFACSRCGRTEKYEQPYCNCGAKMIEKKKGLDWPTERSTKCFK